MTSISLRYFATVARRGSIREAAEELHVAQSALSRQIQKLEQDFGVPLFQRHARGVELTSAGEIFLRHARSSLRQTERVRSELDALKGLRRGTINIQSIESLVPGVLPQAIMRFRARYPGITFEVTVDRTDRIIAAVREGRWSGRASQLSEDHVQWTFIDEIAHATEDPGRLLPPGERDAAAGPGSVAGGLRRMDHAAGAAGTDRAAETRARGMDLIAISELEAEVVGARQPIGYRPLAQREKRTVARSDDQQVLIVMDAFSKPEVLGIEARRSLAITDGQSYVVEFHPAIIAPGRAARLTHDAGRLPAYPAATCAGRERGSQW